MRPEPGAAPSGPMAAVTRRSSLFASRSIRTWLWAGLIAVATAATLTVLAVVVLSVRFRRRDKAGLVHYEPGRARTRIAPLP